MAEFHINIPENKVSFFKELMSNLGYVSMQEEQLDIPDSHKKLVLERIKNSKSEDMLDWEIAKRA